jgi:hypothetical protein
MDGPTTLVVRGGMAQIMQVGWVWKKQQRMKEETARLLWKGIDGIRESEGLQRCLDRRETCADEEIEVMLRRLDRSEMTAMLRRVQRFGIRIVDLLVTMSTNRPSIPNPTGNPIIEFRVTLSGEESSSLTRPSCCCCCCCGCCPCGAAPGAGCAPPPPCCTSCPFASLLVVLSLSLLPSIHQQGQSACQSNNDQTLHMPILQLLPLSVKKRIDAGAAW